MKFLITGAYGFVGTNLCKYLASKGHVCDALDVPAAKREGVPYAKVYTWDDLSRGLAHNGTDGGEMINHGLTRIGTDGGDKEIRVNPCESVVDFSQYDCVVHLAGKAHDLKKVASEQSYFDINVGLTQKIFGAFLNHGLARIGADGCECMGGEKNHGLTRIGTDSGECVGDEKNHGLARIGTDSGVRTFIYFSSSKASADGNAYGRSKLAAEEWLKNESVKIRENPWLKTVILRPAMIHGPGNKGNLNLLWGLARRGLPWPLAAFENRRSFTSIGNICAAVEALAGCRENPRPSEVRTYPVADDTPLSTNRLIELIAEACGKKAKLWKLPKGLMMFAAKVGDVLKLPLNTERIGKLTEDSIVDNAALKKALGWEKMPVDAEEGMRATLRSFGREKVEVEE